VLQGVQHVLQRVATCCSVVACFLQVNLLCGVRCVFKSNYLRFSACEAGCGELGLKLPQIGQRNFGKKIILHISLCVIYMKLSCVTTRGLTCLNYTQCKT